MTACDGLKKSMTLADLNPTFVSYLVHRRQSRRSSVHSPQMHGHCCVTWLLLLFSLKISKVLFKKSVLTAVDFSSGLNSVEGVQ